MLRIIIDKLGTGHADLFLKIDTFPTYVKTGDSYYLPDFLEISDQELIDKKIPEERILQYVTTELIDYWNIRIGTIEKGLDIFIPFDFQDEYIGGLILTPVNQGFKTKIAYSDKIFGFELSKSNIDEVIAERQIIFTHDENCEWLISYEQFQIGLKWSMDELKK